MQPYVKNHQITQCASEPETLDLKQAVGAPCPNSPPFTSYVVNFAIFPNGFFPNVVTVGLADIPLPAESIMTYDGNSGLDPDNPMSPLPGQIVQARHNETFNRTIGPSESVVVRLTLATLGNSGYRRR